MTRQVRAVWIDAGPLTMNGGAAARAFDNWLASVRENAVRDASEEMGDAVAWRDNVRHPILAGLIADLDGAALTDAYRTWWATYTRCIQRAPSNRNGMGVSSTDAAEAGETANRAVREMVAAALSDRSE
jgi:hypothetical protein